MAHEGLRRALLFCLLASCAPVRPSAAPPAPERAPVVDFGDDPRPLARYRSERLALSLPLPDGGAWNVDDRSQPALVATHAATRSRVVVAVFRADELVGRRQCEAMARERKLVPSGDMHAVEDDVAITQGDYDTRILVAVEPGASPGAPLAGHVLAFGGFLRKCYVFAFSTQVDRAEDEPILSSRLAFARARILGGLELDVLGAVPRRPPGAGVAGPR